MAGNNNVAVKKAGGKPPPPLPLPTMCKKLAKMSNSDFSEG